MEKIELIKIIDKLLSMSDYLITDYIKSVATEKHIQTNNLYSAINEMLTEIINTLNTDTGVFFIDETGKTKFLNKRFTVFNVEQLDVLRKLKDNISIDNKTEPPAGTTLHTDLEPTRLDVLYSYLTDEKLIKTTPEMWRYWFTKPSLQAGKQPKKIQWLGAGSVLSNVTMLVCGNFTNHTETAMKAAFKLQSGTKYQQPTIIKKKREFRGDRPYKRIYEIMEHAETKLQS